MDVMRSISGLRGVVGDKFNALLVLKYVNAFCAVIKDGPVVLARDPRPSGEWFSKIAAGTILSSGRDVIDLNIVPTPTALINIVELEAAGGIIITASHNPQNWNALKFADFNGLFLDENNSSELYKRVDNNNFYWGTWDTVAKYYKDENGVKRHIDKLINSSPFKNNIDRNVVIDTAGGASAVILPDLCRRMGCKLIKVLGKNTDGVFTRELEPVPNNIKELATCVKMNKNSIGLATDTDGDRLALVDEEGNAIGEEKTLQLAVKAVLEKKRGSVVANVSTSSAVRAIAEKYGCNFFSSPVGEANVVKKMKNVDALIGGEGNGGVIFPEIHPSRDAQTAVVLILGYLQKNNISLKKAVEELPRRYMVKRKLDFYRDNLDKIDISEVLPEATISSIDGFKYEREKEWIHIRKSGTEPVVRIITEAESKERAEFLAEKTENIFRSSVCVE